MDRVLEVEKEMNRMVAVDQYHHRTTKLTLIFILQLPVGIAPQGPPVGIIKLLLLLLLFVLIAILINVVILDNDNGSIIVEFNESFSTVVLKFNLEMCQFSSYSPIYDSIDSRIFVSYAVIRDI